MILKTMSLKTMTLSFVVLFCALELHAQSGPGGFDHGNGGDMCENRIKTVRDDLAKWLMNGGAKGLRMPAKISPEVYTQTMLEKIRIAQVSCVNEKLYVGKAEKTCKNFTDSSGALRIQCNETRFLPISRSNQYILIHHEYAGLAGYEVNKGEVSNYEISNQIIRGLAGVRLETAKVTLEFLAKVAKMPLKTSLDRAKRNYALCMYIGRMNDGETTQDLYRQLILLDGGQSPEKLRNQLMGLMNFCVGDLYKLDPQPIEFEDVIGLINRIDEIQQHIAEIEKFLQRRFVD